MSGRAIEDRAAALRRAFDESFAAAPPPAAPPTEDFLSVRVAGDPYALRLSDVARVSAAPKIVAVPSRRLAVLGVAAVRGALVPMYSLAALLGCDAGRASHRWVALAAGDEVVGLAFDGIDGFVRARRGTTGALDGGGATRPIVDVIALVRAIQTGRSNV